MKVNIHDADLVLSCTFKDDNAIGFETAENISKIVYVMDMAYIFIAKVLNCGGYICYYFW